ncbi:hypothetical protein [Paractinoplanes durhamensis]|uniref:Uncharacterized protein n=1 Tax=Paractinoplanes durhamensis TaxID=113563 RepID=A0ABQ3Z9I3_9ACTN|nr:hypothetical protein [Actinoplanes durhamensis]GIE06490.1 hypothetical protein Adu01nite_78400 [Actinoplanes durhamensis]
MSLTGRPLIVLAIFATAAALAGTIVLWRRGRRLRLLWRTLGVLVTEALLLSTVGLVANRFEQFYPSWSALRQTSNTSGISYAVKPGHLDASLPALAGPVSTFPWLPAGWTTWHLTAAPAVAVPPGYLLHPAWRYSVVLAVGAWTHAAETAAVRTAGTVAGPAIMVFVPAGPRTSVATLTTSLPAALTGDLRVTAGRWALVTSSSGAALARIAAVRAPSRYPAVAVLGGTPAAASLVSLPAGIASTRAGGLAAALTWACEQTPPPLAASTPPVTHLPVHRRPRHPAARPSGPAVPPAPGGDHVAGQPRR